MVIERDRVVFVDYLRVVACLIVMMVHTSECFYSADSTGLIGSFSMLANEENRLCVSIYDGCIGRMSVPLFMIMSAYLLVPLKPGMSMRQFYARRLKRVLTPFIFFLLAYSLLPLAWGGMTWEQSVNDLKNLIWNFPSLGGHLWFFYPLLGLYLIIPVVSPWLEKSSAKDERLFLGLWMVSLFIPFVHEFVTADVWGECLWNEFDLLWYCSGYLGYLVMAHYIRVHIKWSVRRRMWTGAIAFIIGGGFTAWSFWMMGVPGQLVDSGLIEWGWDFCTPNVALAAFGTFLMFSCIKGTKTPPFVKELSRLSFGMYLMHMLFLTPIASHITIGDNPACPILPVWAAIPATALITFTCCAVTTKIISMVPGSKWIVGA